MGQRLGQGRILGPGAFRRLDWSRLLALSQAAGIDPVKPALAATVGCSFGFMLPVSTPPNALVYGTGRVRIREMVVNGVLLDLAGIVLVSGWVTLFG
jgi:sodium-dependent dicarboxylate transporter 2/3/5